ncbi:MAG TPA: PAS domain-containing protein, partial [Alphaproteobacteria bacterium]|nr:PAS domain-containing protein [Alphaproteobacteria bacterium]
MAFAFASSDLLLELDPTLTIYFAAGACDVLLRRPKESLLGVPFVDIFAPEDRAEVRRALSAIRAGRRAEPIVARLLGAFGAAPQIVFTGNCVPDLDNHFYMSLSMVPGAANALATVKHPLERDRATGLHESAAFGEVAKARLEQGKELGENYALTLLDLSDFERLRPQIDEAVAGSLFATIGETLR